MTQTIRYLSILAIICSFPLNGPLLDLLGWPYDSPGAPTLLKIAPATFLFGAGAALAIFSGRSRFFALLRAPWFLIYLAAVVILIARAVFITESSGGELSTAFVTYGTPLMALISLQLDRDDLNRIGIMLRIFFAFDSLMALAERVVGHRFVPSFMDSYAGEHRAAALLAHPLLASQLTGQLLLILVLSPQRRVPIAVRAVEIILHVLAMFAFGGRTALVFLPFILIAYALFARNRRGEVRVTALQRVLPIAVALAGVLFVFLPIPFIEATLQRFTEDNGSANTRNAAISIIQSLDLHGLLFGIDIYQRTLLMAFFKTSQGIELGWIALTLSYGLIAIIPLAIGLPLFLFGAARTLNRSATYAAIYFLTITAGAAGLASKGLFIADLLILMQVLCQREPVARLRLPRRSDGAAPGLFDLPPLEAGPRTER